MVEILYFVGWTFMLYWVHRIIHVLPVLRDIHLQHHVYINKHNASRWHWNNLFLFNDTWICTLDVWLTDVIPTLIFSAVTGAWWIFVFYYFWAALVQEKIEHNPRVNLYPIIGSGSWHLVHHRSSRNNYGLFVIFWDIVFGTNQYV